MKEAQTTQEALNAALKEAQAWKAAALAVNAERDALAAKIAVIKNAKTIGELIAAINATPAQCLREIRAEAIADFAKALLNTVQIPNGPMTRVDYYKAAIRHAIQFASTYAEQIRQGGVE